jgi:hypothetical protein
VIHIAGFPVRVGREARQLCAWCGLMLSDCDYANIAQPEGQTGDPFHPFEVGVLVDVTKNGPVTQSIVLPHKDGGPMPAGFCGDDGKARLRLVTDAAIEGGK